MSTWLITGASSGLGRALAQAVLDRGDNAVVTARIAGHVQDLVDAHPDTALAVALEVSDHDQVVAAVNAATDRFGAVDVLVNNAWHGYPAAVEEAAADEINELFATNFFGPVDLIKQVLPQMRSRRSDTVVNILSIGAPRSNPASGYYTASKAALEGMSDALNRAAQAIITTVEAEQAPFRLLLESDAIHIVREELHARVHEIDTWAHISVTADFQE